MFDSIKSFFKKNGDGNKATIPQKEASADDLHAATCALLLEIAYADNKFTDDEKRSIQEIVKAHLNLSKKQTEELLELSEKKRKESIDLWQFTQLIKNNFSLEQKINIIEMIWKVIYVDGNLDKHEDYLVHKLSQLLGLSHKQLIDAKIKIKHKKK